MKKIIILLLLLTLKSSISFATIRRIGYWGTAITNVDYSTADLAVTASSTGDTILVYPSAITWSFNNLNKKLAIIGTGYYHYPGANGATNYNANLQNAQPSSYININFYPGSDGTIITGCDFTTNSSTTSGTAGINNIKISNCRIYLIYLNQPYTYDNWEISKSEIGYYGLYVSNSSAKFTNLKFFNNICLGSYAPFYNLNTTNGYSGIIENCTFISSSANFNNQAFLIQNCIFYNFNFSNYSNCVFNNNIFTSQPSPGVTGANNITSASSSSLFLAYPTQGTYSNDERFKLKAGSPALAAGINNVDCGAFGGVNPYKLSGIPAIPAIYKLTAPTSAASSNPYTITFSIRANN